MSLSSTTDEELFFQAVDMPESQREDFLASACEGDKERLERIAKILEGHKKNSDDGFILDSPPDALKVLESGVEFTEIGEKAGDQIGRYRLLERIGEGGMGVVYMAEQTVGVRRRVALKIIKLGMDTRQVIARFEAERQAMALFDHPNIAKVIDIGATESGRPYFVLELVKGLGLMEFVRDADLNLDEKLNLFVQICNAVQHAHQKGIIHRDLKPSNVLVTLYDGRPVPKVIDFGIAKAIGHQRLTEKTLFTRYSAMVGTPQYMSPEQAEPAGMDVDTRSDIYSLGVILYELVTGSTPLTSSQLKSLNPLALFETLRDTDIETPSQRLKQTKKELEPRKYNQESRLETKATSRVERELDWVILKALSRDRQQRYATANELAFDVQRFIDGEPVLAAPPSRAKWLGAFCRRNRSAVISGAAILVTMLFAAAACLMFGFTAMRANKALNESNLALNKANRELNENLERLRDVEQKLQREAEKQKYDLAIALATTRFDQMLVNSVADRIFEQNPEATLCCSGIDNREFLILENPKLLGEGIKKIREHYDEADEYFQTMFEATYSEDDLIFGAQGVVEDEPSHVEYRELYENELVVVRHNYFRMLVEEYRKVFGEQHSNVAEALILLAACLEEQGEVDEAESRAREAKGPA